ncbi:MAG: glutamine amidotransferase, partial [Pseudomonadota bacterium]
MCGIVGLFLKDPSLEPQLGALLTDMLITMTDRGPDSAGIAIYGDETPGVIKVTVQSGTPEADFAALEDDLSGALGTTVSVHINSTHAVLGVPEQQVKGLRAVLADIRPNVRMMSRGQNLEIYKEVGLPRDVVDRFGIAGMAGTHGIGHTRMATESAVTTLGAHPFNTGDDQCLVHNGSLSNHNSLRRKLVRAGVEVRSENDS